MKKILIGRTLLISGAILLSAEVIGDGSGFLGCIGCVFGLLGLGLFASELFKRDK